MERGEHGRDASSPAETPSSGPMAEHGRGYVRVVLSAQRMMAPYQEHQETAMLAALYLDRGLMLPAKSMQSNSKCVQHFWVSKHHGGCMDVCTGQMARGEEGGAIYGMHVHV